MPCFFPARLRAHSAVEDYWPQVGFAALRTLSGAILCLQATLGCSPSREPWLDWPRGVPSERRFPHPFANSGSLRQLHNDEDRSILTVFLPSQVWPAAARGPRRGPLS